MPDFPDEILMRFADGELDAQTEAAVEAAIDSDEALAARVAMFMDTRSAAKAAFAPLAEKPVPAQLRANVEAMVERSRSQAGQPKPGAARLLRPANDWLPRAAAAAGIAALLGLGGGYWMGGASSTSGGKLIAAHVDDPALVAALGSVPSGEEAALGDSRFRAIGSLHDSGQKLCREFEIVRADGVTEQAIACRDGAQWSVRVAVAAPAAGADYAPAGSIEALDAYIAAIGATPLDAETEKRALAGE